MKIAFYDDDEMTRLVFHEQINARFKDVDLKVYETWASMAINIKRFKPDIIIIDYKFKNGLKANILYEIFDELNVPVLLYTGCAESTVKKDAAKNKDKLPSKLEYFQKCRFNIFERLTSFKDLQPI